LNMNRPLGPPPKMAIRFVVLKLLLAHMKIKQATKFIYKCLYSALFNKTCQCADIKKKNFR
jgi:hypothetical protein